MKGWDDGDKRTQLKVDFMIQGLNMGAFAN